MNVSRGRSRGWGICLGLLAFTLHAAGAAAQDFRGGIVGRVSDESGGLLQGFKKLNRENVEVRVGDRLQIDFKMEVGGISEVVNVAADTPLLETRSGSAGQVIGE